MKHLGQFKVIFWQVTMQLASNARELHGRYSHCRSDNVRSDLKAESIGRLRHPIRSIVDGRFYHTIFLRNPDKVYEG